MTLWKPRILGAIGLALAVASAGACKEEPASARQPPQQQNPNQAPMQQQPQQAPRAPQARQERIDPRAAAVVKRMSNYMDRLAAFTLTADSMTEVVARSGEKVQILARSRLAVQRPNKLVSERKGQVAHLKLVYDGNRMLLVNPRLNQYAVARAPSNLDAALDFARDRLNVEAPGADLLYTDVYEGLMAHTLSGRYLGPAEVRGVPCDHVAFRGERADWELWVKRGPEPLPMRYSITTTDQTTRPEFTVEISDWNTQPVLSPVEFSTAPPPNARRVEFGTLIQNALEAAKAAVRSGQPQKGPTR